VLTALTGLGIVVAGQVNVRLPDRWSSRARATVALTVSSAAATYLVLVVVVSGPLAAIIPGVVVMMLCHGVAWPNVMSIGMGITRRDAGSASALLGAMQFGVGGLASPIGGLFGGHQALGTVASMLLLILGAAALFLAGVRGADPPLPAVADLAPIPPPPPTPTTMEQNHG
jgi:DHA1 family bicyclomycin/chloramphenicol resistance-like MFS transporter